MKPSRPVLPIVMLTLCAIASAQSANQPVAAVSDAQKAFGLMKTLAGKWQGSITTDNPAEALALMKTLVGNVQAPTATDSPASSTDNPMLLSIRVASHGNALVHELTTVGPEMTVFYVEKNRLALTHYCDFGDRPHLIARPSPEGNVVDFELAELSDSDQVGHVTRGVFTIIDANHHVEDWTFTPAGAQPMHAHTDFKRVQ